MTTAREARTPPQNRMMWRLLSAIGGHCGYTKPEMYELAKKLLLVPILLADPEEVAFHKAWVEVERLRRLGSSEAETTEKEVIRQIATSQLLEDTMAEFIMALEVWVSDLGVNISWYQSEG